MFNVFAEIPIFYDISEYNRFFMRLTFEQSLMVTLSDATVIFKGVDEQITYDGKAIYDIYCENEYLGEIFLKKGEEKFFSCNNMIYLIKNYEITYPHHDSIIYLFRLKEGLSNFGQKTLEFDDIILEVDKDRDDNVFIRVNCKEHDRPFRQTVLIRNEETKHIECYPDIYYITVTDVEYSLDGNNSYYASFDIEKQGIITRTSLGYKRLTRNSNLEVFFYDFIEFYTGTYPVFHIKCLNEELTREIINDNQTYFYICEDEIYSLEIQGITKHENKTSNYIDVLIKRIKQSVTQKDREIYEKNTPFDSLLSQEIKYFKDLEYFFNEIKIKDGFLFLVKTSCLNMDFETVELRYNQIKTIECNDFLYNISVIDYGFFDKTENNWISLELKKFEKQEIIQEDPTINLEKNKQNIFVNISYLRDDFLKNITIKCNNNILINEKQRIEINYEIECNQNNYSIKLIQNQIQIDLIEITEPEIIIEDSQLLRVNDNMHFDNVVIYLRFFSKNDQNEITLTFFCENENLFTSKFKENQIQNIPCNYQEYYMIVEEISIQRDEAFNYAILKITRQKPDNFIIEEEEIKEPKILERIFEFFKSIFSKIQSFF